MKKGFSTLLCVLLCFMLALNGFAANQPTQSADGGNMTLETVVPTDHKITITYNYGGYVLTGGQLVESGAQLTVPRFSSLRMDVIARLDSHFKSVTVNGEDKTADLRYGQLTVEHIASDMEIVFRFEKCEDAGKPDETTPTKPDTGHNPADPCLHTAMHGTIFQGKQILENAQLNIDLGEIQTQADKKGKYSVKEIKDGCHKAVISDENGKPLGEEVFCIAVDDTLKAPKVTRLANGTQLVLLPKNTKDFSMDMVVEADGSITVRPYVEIPGNPITDNPVIVKTGAFLQENPMVCAGIFALSLTGLFLLLLLPLRRRKKAEDETAAV